MILRRYLLACSVLGLACAGLLAKPVPIERDYLDRLPTVAEQGSIEPAGVPLKVRLIARGTVVYLDRGGLTETAYRQRLQEAQKTGQLPPAPRVDVIFELENTAKHDLQLLIGGDVSGSLRLFLQGPGAAHVLYRPKNESEDFIKPVLLILPPGGRQQWVFKELDCSGPRDKNRLYWTQPGYYLLSAGFTVAIRPALRGMVPHWYQKDHGNVAIMSGALRLVVLPGK